MLLCLYMSLINCRKQHLFIKVHNQLHVSGMTTDILYIRIVVHSQKLDTHGRNMYLILDFDKQILCFTFYYLRSGQSVQFSCQNLH